MRPVFPTNFQLSVLFSIIYQPLSRENRRIVTGQSSWIPPPPSPGTFCPQTKLSALCHRSKIAISPKSSSQWPSQHLRVRRNGSGRRFLSQIEKSPACLRRAAARPTPKSQDNRSAVPPASATCESTHHLRDDIAAVVALLFFPQTSARRGERTHQVPKSSNHSLPTPAV